MKFTIKTDREDDGRWIAEAPELPGVLCYGATQNSLTTERRNRLSSHSRLPLNEPICSGEGYWEGKTL